MQILIKYMSRNEMVPFFPSFMLCKDSIGKQLIKKVKCYFPFNMAVLVYYLYKI